MGNSNKGNDRPTSNTLYSENSVTKYSRDCSQNSSFGISKKYIVHHIFFENLNVFVIMIGIGAPADHKANIFKNEFCRRKNVGDGRQQDLVRRKWKLSVFG
jgi:hypothetical protein